MKIRNLDKELMTEEGEPFKDKTTFKKALIIAATTPTQKDESADDKYKLGMIAVKLSQARKGAVELTAEDITLIKKRVGELFGPMVVLRVYDLLEGKQSAEKRVDPKDLEDDEPPLKEVAKG